MKKVKKTNSISMNAWMVSNTLKYATQLCCTKD